MANTSRGEGGGLFGGWTLAGVTGALGLVAVTLGIRLLEPWPSLFDLAGERLVAATPGAAFEALLSRLQHWGKPGLLLGLVLLSVVLLSAVAHGYGRAVRCQRNGAARVAAAVALGLGLWALLGWLSGTFAQPSPLNLQVSGSALLGFIAYALVLAALAPEPALVRPHVPDVSRRRLVAGLASLAVLADGGLLWRLVSGMLEPQVNSAHAPRLAAAPADTGARVASPTAAASAGVFDAVAGLPANVTDNDTFYRISKNFVDPNVSLDGWSLEVFGLVEQPQRLSYEQLRALPAVDEMVTLQCISNQVGGPLTGNAVWRGVRLSTLLASAQVKPDARYVIFTSSDNYVESYPLDKALAPTTILAHTMNGEPLQKRHGFPLRVISTGRYGMKNPKWLHKIELSADPQPGWWVRQGWNTDAVVRTMSRIDVPQAGVALPAGEAVLGGIAFAGERGISKVEVSPDGGASWREATIEHGPTPGIWTRWIWRWPNASPGRHQVLVRATDGTGALQDPTSRGSFPRGATGYDQVEVVLE